jgi:hypothetical protein
MNNIRRVRSFKDLAISSVIIIAGIICLYLNSDSMFILGVTLLTLGVILVLALRSAFRIEGQEGTFLRKTYDFPNNRKESVIAFLEGRSDRLESSNTGSLLLYIYYKRDRSSGFGELNEYTMYEYKPCTGLMKLDPKQLSQIK